MSIPELEIEIGSSALCGRFTTVEGLLNASKDQLKEQFGFFFGDSSEDGEARQKMASIDQALNDIATQKRSATLVLDDPAGNSYIQSITDDAEDPRLSKEFYTRTFEQNDELGLNDMRVENYGDLGTIHEEE